MAVKTVQGQDEIRELANMLSDYWSTREMEYSEQWAEEYIRQGHAKEMMGDKFFVKTGEDGVTASISLVFWEGGVAELRDFYVVEGERDSGIGEELLDHAVEYCDERGVRKIHAKVFPELEDFFREHGFEVEGELKDHFQEGEDLLIVARFRD